MAFENRLEDGIPFGRTDFQRLHMLLSGRVTGSPAESKTHCVFFATTPILTDLMSENRRRMPKQLARAFGALAHPKILKLEPVPQVQLQTRPCSGWKLWIFKLVRWRCMSQRVWKKRMMRLGENRLVGATSIYFIIARYDVLWRWCTVPTSLMVNSPSLGEKVWLLMDKILHHLEYCILSFCFHQFVSNKEYGSISHFDLLPTTHFDHLIWFWKRDVVQRFGMLSVRAPLVATFQTPPNAIRCHTLVGGVLRSARALPDTPGIDFKWNLPAKD